MLTSLSIKNYALIEELDVDFNSGLTIITGETGAGKSILLGGLALVLGKRADISNVKDKSNKCIVEATFDIANYNLKQVFKDENLDYDTETIIRREILPSGKSRAFVNDSPVNLEVLKLLSSYLIDIHSQHQTLELIDDNFQFNIIDAFAQNKEFLEQYSIKLNQLKALKKELQEKNTLRSESIKEQDYNLFLLNELQEANLISGELEGLEEEYETLNNIEEIKEVFSLANELLNDEQIGILSTLNTLKTNLNKLSGLASTYSELFERVNSVIIELDDVYAEIESKQDELEADPKRLIEINEKLQTIHSLFLKHSVSTIDDLISVKEGLNEKVNIAYNIDDTIEKLTLEIKNFETSLDKIADKIHDNRIKAIPDLIIQIEEILNELGMPNAKFNISVSKTEQYYINGKDDLSFLFSANKGTDFKPLKKAASGGELSRIMLAVKSILAKYIQLPTIMFDEIDTGVSGEISNKMSAIMKTMSSNLQVFTITHLPQIAAKGDTHFKVYKEDQEEETITKLVKLNSEERIVEIAQMLGGTKLSTSALEHAKQLLN